MIREVGEEKKNTFSSASGPHLHFARQLARGLQPLELFAACICCLKYQLELSAEEAGL